MAKKARTTSNKSAIDLKQLEEVFKLMKKHAVTELEYEKGAERFFVSTQVGGARMMTAPIASAPSASPAVTDSSVPAQKETAPKNDKVKEFKSPFVGTFYRSAAPGSDPYVKEGQLVKRGDTLCIIEAMKLMNEIEAEF